MVVPGYLISAPSISDADGAAKMGNHICETKLTNIPCWPPNPPGIPGGLGFESPERP